MIQARMGAAWQDKTASNSLPDTGHHANSTGSAQSVLTRQDSYYPIAQMRKDKEN